MEVAIIIDNNTDSEKRELGITTPEALTPKISLPSEPPEIQQPNDSSEIIPSNKPLEGNLQKQNVDNLISDIDNSEKLIGILTGSNLDKFSDSDLAVSPTINQTTETLRNINAIKDELCKLTLDPCKMEFINSNITPLLIMLQQLSSSAYNLANATSLLSISPIVHPKNSELKDIIHLVYKMNDQCEDIYEVVKRNINLVLKNNE